MPRKKISDTGEISPATVDLGDDEELVVENTTTRRVRKEKRHSDVEPEIETNSVDAELILDDEEESEYTDSIASFLDRGEDGDISDSYCSIIIRREPDGINDRFDKPCSGQAGVGTFRGIALKTSRSDIEERVQHTYGGGHYTFQIRTDGRLGRSWTATLMDPPNGLAQRPPDQPQPVIQQPATQQRDSVDVFLDTLEKQQRMKTLLFGDDKKFYEQQIAELKAEISRHREDPAEPKSERLLLLDTALKAQTPELQDKLLTHLFPADDGNGKSTVGEIIETVVEHQDKIVPLVGGLLSMLFGQPQSAATNGGGLDAFLSGPAPEMPQPSPAAPPRFQRPQTNAEAPTPEPATTEAESK